MSLKFFAIPVRDSSSGETEWNAFLSSQRVLAVDRHFVEQGENSFWAICVDYLSPPSGGPGPGGNRKGRIDYREVLPPQEFAVFARLRELRKQLAQAEAVSVYTIFTNDQLAEMVRRRVNRKADLEAITGVGDARVSTYGGSLGMCATLRTWPCGPTPRRLFPTLQAVPCMAGRARLLPSWA
jgi:superfamily II DNA helicase RecQ